MCSVQLCRRKGTFIALKLVLNLDQVCTFSWYRCRVNHINFHSNASVNEDPMYLASERQRPARGATTPIRHTSDNHTVYTLSLGPRLLYSHPFPFYSASLHSITITEDGDAYTEWWGLGGTDFAHDPWIFDEAGPWQCCRTALFLL